VQTNSTNSIDKKWPLSLSGKESMLKSTTLLLSGGQFGHRRTLHNQGWTFCRQKVVFATCRFKPVLTGIKWQKVAKTQIMYFAYD